jgi:hypothetical protein
MSAKSALLSYFDQHKKEIKRFMSRNKIKYSKASTDQLYMLMQYCDSLDKE